MRRNVYVTMVIVCLALFISCEDATHLPAIDAGSRVYSAKEAGILLPLMSEGRVERVVLLGGTPSDFFKSLRGNQDYGTNNREILKIAKDHPGHFIAFPGIRESTALESVQSMAGEGAMGFEVQSSLFSAEHVSLFPIWTFLQEKGIPLALSGDGGVGIAALEHILGLYPRLKVICPNFCSAIQKPDGIAALFKIYPGLYVSSGFRNEEALEKGGLSISRDPGGLRRLMLQYPDRFLFSANASFGPESPAASNPLADSWRGYRRLLSQSHYHFPVLSRRWQRRGFRLAEDGALNGLFLPPEVLEKVYYQNVESLLGIRK